jgi:hypothetical protein
VSAKPLDVLERKYHVISKQIANSANAADIFQLEKLREAILTEAREISRKLNLPMPAWTRKKT